MLRASVTLSISTPSVRAHTYPCNYLWLLIDGREADDLSSVDTDPITCFEVRPKRFGDQLVVIVLLRALNLEQVRKLHPCGDRVPQTDSGFALRRTGICASPP